MVRFQFLDLVKRVEIHIFGRHTTSYCYNKPQYVVIEPTAKCNLSCVWCIRFDQDYPKRNLRDMSLSDFRRITEQIGHVREIIPFGLGEPLLHPQIDEIISIASQHADCVRINSNGILLDEEMTKRLDSSGLTELVLSIDSPDPGVFNEIRKGANLDRIKRNARFFTSHSTIPLEIHAVLSSLTLDSSLNLPMMARELGARRLTFNVLYATSETRQLIPDRKKLQKTCQNLRSLCTKLKLKTDVEEVMKPQATNMCITPLLSTFIDAEGNMTPCCNYPTLRLGNIFDKDFLECWNSQETRRFRVRVLRGDFPAWCRKFCLAARQLGAR